MHISRVARPGGLAAIGFASLALAACGMGGGYSPAAAPPASAASPSASSPSSGAAAASLVLSERATPLGEVLVNSSQRTLYTYAKDTGATSTCTGSCATVWPPQLVPTGDNLTAQPPLPGHLGTITRADGARQATYDGHPLYTFTGDTAAGQTNGAGFKGVWFAIGLDGKPLAAGMSTGSSAQPASPTTAPSQANAIPQGGGDHDADNSGGPDDGDGNR
jgi:predicted lipoprotein with Yx(FWY)xxD motif